MPRKTRSTHVGLGIGQRIWQHGGISSSCPPQRAQGHALTAGACLYLFADCIDSFLCARLCTDTRSQGQVGDASSPSTAHSSAGVHLLGSGLGELPNGLPIVPSASLNPTVVPCTKVRLRRHFRAPKPLLRWDLGPFPQPSVHLHLDWPGGIFS